MTATADPGAPGALFAAYLGEKRPQIEAFLATCAPACVPGTAEATRADLNRYLYQPLARFTASGGKRTRPALALLGCEAVGGDPAAALSTAAAIEYFQSAALIHDDIADKSELRRGEPCTYVTEGTGVAINIGDLGLVNVLALVLRDQKLPAAIRADVAERLVQMEERTLEGQALDLGWVRDGRWDISVEDYLYMASHKTAYYSAAVPLVTGALCGDGTPERPWMVKKEWEAALARLGMERIPFKNLRNSWRTISRWELGIPEDYVERMMGHGGKNVGEIHYDRPAAEQFADVVADAYVRYRAKAELPIRDK